MSKVGAAGGSLSVDPRDAHVVHVEGFYQRLALRVIDKDSQCNCEHYARVFARMPLKKG